MRRPVIAEDTTMDGSSNATASAPLVAPRILLRPQGSSRPEDALSRMAEQPLPSLEQKQRDYAAARARIFKENPGRAGKGSNSANRGRGRGSATNSVTDKKYSHDFKSD